MNYRLFLIEDDPLMATTLTDVLHGQGYTVDGASNSEFASEIGLADTFDLIIIDAVMPPSCSFEICRELRRRMLQSPILMLSASGELGDKISAFQSGADDYLTKPVDMVELQVRIEALLRRSAQAGATKVSAYEFSGMHVDFRKSEIVRCGAVIGLSERESRLLQYFVENRGKTISRNTLLRQVWGYRRAPLTRTVDVHILRLRQKVERDSKKPEIIVTVPGFGYRFDG